MTVAELQSLADTRKLTYKKKDVKATLISLHEAYDAERIAEHEEIAGDFFERMEAAQLVDVAANELQEWAPVQKSTLPMSAEEKIEKYECDNLRRTGSKKLTVKQRRQIRRTLNRGRSIWTDDIVHFTTRFPIPVVTVKTFTPAFLRADQ